MACLPATCLKTAALPYELSVVHTPQTKAACIVCCVCTRGTFNPQLARTIKPPKGDDRCASTAYLLIPELLPKPALVDSCRSGASRGPSQREQHCSAASAAVGLCCPCACLPFPAAVLPWSVSYRPSFASSVSAARHGYIHLPVGNLSGVETRGQDRPVSFAATVLRNRPLFPSLHIVDPGPLRVVILG
ncbi:hypothetical protein LX32DRAFT_635996 [Colletotrichum zoysiae]|uniref:Uncharacterized protein n=1 Tax=Colletotrichum zoysiae TaxID=1216348 RepID=A0AAD9M7Z8_9PEZI|nr:hypothetical protein LX32DRAFT_635996 [Colletotrichum zoysiae]